MIPLIRQNYRDTRQISGCPALGGRGVGGSLMTKGQQEGICGKGRMKLLDLNCGAVYTCQNYTCVKTHRHVRTHKSEFYYM